MIKQFLVNQPKPTKPEWLVVGAFVKVVGWYGKVIEIAESDRAIYVRVFGAKSVFHHNSGGDLLEYVDGMIVPATENDALENYKSYLKQSESITEQIKGMIE